ncbi:MAG: peptidylprolyl isomerase [Acidobacteriota bacterium]|jgi:peptidyl-prolyl cis-trans isomerase C
MPVAQARHILVSSAEQANDIKQQIADGADFAEMAKAHSSCPSSRNGGDLGQFGPGQMVPEFDAVIWKESVGDVHGPVKTAFGYHLIEITNRTD